MSSLFSKLCAIAGCFGVAMGLLLGVSNLVCELADVSDDDLKVMG